MGLKYINKDTLGVCMALLLIILLTQIKFFKLFTDNSLGRIIFLTFVIFVAYTNKILGLLVVLFLILSFNNNDMYLIQSYNYYEGFENSSKDSDKKIQREKKIPQKTENMETVASKEGFCMSDRELNIQRGKQSNSVPILNDSRNQTSDVSPSDKSVFSGDYAAF